MHDTNTFVLWCCQLYYNSKRGMYVKETMYCALREEQDWIWTGLTCESLGELENLLKPCMNTKGATGITKDTTAGKMYLFV